MFSAGILLSISQKIDFTTTLPAKLIASLLSLQACELVCACIYILFLYVASQLAGDVKVIRLDAVTVCFVVSFVS